MIFFIIWVGGVVSWLVTVAEAMIIAPVWAISFLSPEGEGFTGERAKQGWLLILSVFLRPTLMLFGLFFAAAVSFILFAYVNAVFASVFFNFFWELHISFAYWLVGFLAQLVIYTIIVLTTMHTIYGLIHIIPDRILRWIGGGDAPLGDMGAETASKQAFGAVISSATSAAPSAMLGQKMKPEGTDTDGESGDPDAKEKTGGAGDTKSSLADYTEKGDKPAESDKDDESKS